MGPIHQLAPAHARFIHDLIIIKTRIEVKLSFAAGPKFFGPARPGNRRRPLSLLDNPKAAVNYSHLR